MSEVVGSVLIWILVLFFASSSQCGGLNHNLPPLPNLLEVAFGTTMVFYGWWGVRLGRSLLRFVTGIAFTGAGLLSCAFGFNGIIGWNLCHVSEWIRSTLNVAL